MNTELALIPKPRNYSEDGGTLALKEDFKVWCTDDTALEAERLREFLAEHLDLRLSLMALEMEGFVVALSPRKPVIEQLLRRVDPEGYIIHVGRRELILRGGSRTGIFWGEQTLRQMFSSGSRTVSSRIMDDPALSWRGLHLDLSGATPSFASLVLLLDQMSQYKMNTVIMEYQDRLVYDGHPRLSRSGALTSSQLQRVLDFANDRHLQVIPLVPTVGRTGYILRHQEYRKLGEKGSLQQVQLGNPAVLDLMKQILDQVLAVHPQCEFIHLGGDMCPEAARAPEMGRKIRKKGQLQPFMKHIGDLCQHVLDKGVRPMIWTDVFWQKMDPFAVRALPKEVVLVDRNYAAEDVRCPFVFWGPQDIRLSRHAVETSQRFPRTSSLWFDGLSEAELGFLEKYWQPDATWGQGEAFPLLKFFLDEGFEVLGAGAVKGVDDKAPFVPRHRVRLNNLCTWAKVAERDGLLGVVATARSRDSLFAPVAEPYIGLTYTMLAAADFFWRGAHSDVEDYERRAGLNLYGDDEQLPNAIALLDEGIRQDDLLRLGLASEILSNIRENAVHEKRFVDYLALACDLLSWQKEFDAQLDEIGGRLHLADRGKMLPEEIQERSEEIKLKLKQANGMRRRIRNVMKGQAFPEDIREIAEGQVSGREQRAKMILESLGKSK